ncbi:bifunctional phosphoribosylaminoimidazolecarboxamide formyltransferase/IMP cyclohydrolase [Lyngbya confervoides]|uniref:Bifunctional purine biosynthesis protein PurH n=1 Tax=Lyngbya confervoides BDU141951 TaxID=1574623 RepID=A0ABD4T3Q8_9CYAN|nr:bifunctional phosphoribosylaminoimidazolecarboxamide formyltransferase/IMP cyclohydrolase [Lyngbya confervoides]MCM1983240.1 bifunctional phosphoribosylaminoimidazolecarboxamide formyltransferase/IMP cyclohydrolase [Lyngbya confervoides BDU141951]
MTRLALLSTSDKTGLVPFAQTLVEKYGFEIISSGGTAATLQAANIPVTKVSDYTGAPEILGGRVKTLHPKIHGGLLARRNLAADQADLASQHIQPIDLVVVNLYPFEQTVQRQQEKGDTSSDQALIEAVEQIDIGGPTMLRSAAKNFAHVTVLCTSHQYEAYLTELDQHQGQVSLAFRKRCAMRVFERTAAYDQAIAAYLRQSEATSTDAANLPEHLMIAGQAQQTLRYGENPHQRAMWYQSAPRTGWSAAEQLQGKELSYNNLVDLEAARRIIAEFCSDEESPTAAILKHNNPCGMAQADTIAMAYRNAFAADSVSAFGGIVALNRPIDALTAQTMTQTFLECIVAPACDPDAAEILQKKSNLRVLILPDLVTGQPITAKAIAGGWLVQDADHWLTPPSDWDIVTDRRPDPAMLAEMSFAWRVVKHVKSNAIVVTRDRATLGVGAGQMNRVGAAKIALEQAGDRAQGAVLASDGFFPFDDSVRTAAAAGIVAIVQPGGSIRDQESIVAANELGVIMALTGTRHFLH